MSSQRIGRFSINRQIINDDPDIARTILAGVIVVRAEALWHSDSIDYIGLCDEFDEVPKGMVAPDYEVEVNVERESHDLMTLGKPMKTTVLGRRHVTRRFVRTTNAGIKTTSAEKDSW